MTGDELLAALRGLPGGEAVIAAADEHTHLVGGAVRDLLLGAVPRELDVAVEGDARAFALRLGTPREDHERFGTLVVDVGDVRVDVAATRRESYPAPGVLPEVAPAPLAEDLLRRDFTVNAIALGLQTGTLESAPGAFDDLAERVLRVLHDRSFTDDPTRLLRMLRYAERLGFAVEPHTAELARAATLANVSGARVGAELRLALTEPDPIAVLARIEGLLPLAAPERTLIDRALELLPDEASRALLLFGAATREDQNEPWIRSLEFMAGELFVIRAVWSAASLSAELERAARPSQIHATLHTAPLEAVALAGALGPVDAARRWLDELRFVSLEIGGDDLIAAGVAPGPELGARLAHALALKLDGECRGRDSELAAALEFAP